MQKEPWSKRFRIHLFSALLLVTLGIWLSSGTMAPYAATLSFSIVTQPCHYLVNVDDWHFRAPFLMLQGADRGLWQDSVVLRRILYPLLSYPFMKLLGFEIGGFISSVLLHIAAITFFISFCRKTFGEFEAIIGIWLLAFYPGIYYWAGLPYAYVSIVPCSLTGMIILWQLNTEESSKKIYLLAFLMGILFLAYDLFPFFGMAALFLLLLRQQYRVLPGTIVLLLVPAVISNWLLWSIFRVPFLNSNTSVYPVIFGSYLKKIDFLQWWPLLRDFPKVSQETYLYSNFLFLPLLFAIFVLMGLVRRKVRLTVPELSLFAAGLVLYLFLNLAPPYEGWQMRGMWIPRLYQPVFVAMLTFSMRECARYWREPSNSMRLITFSLFAATIIGNFRVSFGPVMNSRFSSHVYYHFYKHSDKDTQYRNLKVYGRRPLGFCQPQLPSSSSETKPGATD